MKYKEQVGIFLFPVANFFLTGHKSCWTNYPVKFWKSTFK